MLFIILIAKFLTFAASASVANTSSLNRKRALQKALLKNLNASHSGNNVTNNVKTFDLANRASTQSQDELYKIPRDLQLYIFSFLKSNDLSNTMLVSPLYYNLSYVSNAIKLKKQHPNFVLEENWMNIVLSSFLQLRFENGIFNIDDLFMAIYDFKFKKNADYQNSTSTLDLLTFFYELHKGPGSYLPVLPIDFLAEIIRTHAKQNVPKSLNLTDAYFINFIDKKGFDEKQYMDEIKHLFNFIASNPKPEELRAYLGFDSGRPIHKSALRVMPSFLKIALFDFILPFCDDEVTYRKALEMISYFAISQTLFDQIDSKFPFLMGQINDYIGEKIGGVFLPLRRALRKRFPRTAIIGLDYLLTRDHVKPFDLKELEAMNPDYERLVFEFLRTITMTLTEMDMITQMKEACLFDDIENQNFHYYIDLILSGKIIIKYHIL